MEYEIRPGRIEPQLGEVAQPRLPHMAPCRVESATNTTSPSAFFFVSRSIVPFHRVVLGQDLFPQSLFDLCPGHRMTSFPNSEKQHSAKTLLTRRLGPDQSIDTL